MSFRFNSCSIKTENEKEATLICRLKGFKPSEGSHSATATVTNNVLIVTANIGTKTHQYKVSDIGVSDESVNCKPESDQVQVKIKKPNKEYSLASKLPK